MRGERIYDFKVDEGNQSILQQYKNTLVPGYIMLKAV